MVRPMRRAVIRLLGTVAVAGFVFSCGARTPLLAPDEVVTEAGVDATKKDARDVSVEDVVPPIDVTKKDADKSDCPDADSTFIYVVTDTNELLSFYPPTASFRSWASSSAPPPSTRRPSPWPSTARRGLRRLQRREPLQGQHQGRQLPEDGLRAEPGRLLPVWDGLRHDRRRPGGRAVRGVDGQQPPRQDRRERDLQAHDRRPVQPRHRPRRAHRHRGRASL